MSALPADIRAPAVATPAMSSGAAASERLARSREHLRQALRESASLVARTSSVDADRPDEGIVARALRHWHQWRPLGVVGVMAVRAANAVVRPLVDRNPLGVALGAVLAGALISWSRPWRWIVGSSVLAGLLPRLFARPSASIGGNVWFALARSVADAASGRHRHTNRNPDPTVHASDHSSSSR